MHGCMNLIILILLGYLGYQVYLMFKKPSGSAKQNVRGENRKKPLDLKDQDVQDAQYEDLKDDK
jgi:hypothetical protein